MCTAANVMYTIMDMLTSKNIKQVQVPTGMIINRDEIKSRDSTVNEGDRVKEAVRNVRDGQMEKEGQAEAERSLVLYCKALAPGRVRG